VGGDRDFDHVVLAQRFEFIEESTAPPVEFVGDDPIQLDRIENRDCADQVRSDLWFGAELDSWGHMGRVPSLFALLRLLAPVLGQKQLMRKKGRSPGSDRCEKDADLAVVFLAGVTGGKLRSGAIELVRSVPHRTEKDYIGSSDSTETAV
jgi:hypothetical protein